MSNIGAYWAERGEIVLMIDMDLTAPGLSYSPLLGEWLHEDGTNNGFSDLLETYFRGRATHPDQLHFLPPRHLIREVHRPGPNGLPQKEMPWGKKHGKRGRLLAIDAIQQRWSRHGPDQGEPSTDGEQSDPVPYLIRANLPNAIPPEEGWGESETAEEHALRALALAIRTDLENWRDSEVPSRGIDRVLIDCRTGFPELVEMTLGYLSDRMVLVAGLNEQNRAGMRHLLEALKSRIGIGEFPGTLRLVFSPVPRSDDEMHVINARKACERILETMMRTESSSQARESLPSISLLHYTPLLATGDSPLVITQPHLLYAQEVREIARWLEGNYRMSGVIENVKERLDETADLLASAIQKEQKKSSKPKRKNPVIGLPRWDWPLPPEMDPTAREAKRDALLAFAPGIAVDRDQFLNGLSWSVSMSIEDKEKILKETEEMSEFRVQELRTIFAEERQKFLSMDESLWEQLLQRFRDHQMDWARLLAGQEGVKRFLTAPLTGDHPHQNWELWPAYWIANVYDMHDEFNDAPRLALLLDKAIEAAHGDPNSLGQLAVFLKTKTQDMDRAEELYQRAIDADPRNAINLGNFALFMQDVRKNMDYAEELFQRAIEADPQHANHLGNFALFMHKVRNNMDYAEELFQRAIEADPRHATNLGDFALFMETVRNNMDRAEDLYQRAIEADPRHAHHLGNFAVFMETVRNNMDRAEELYQRAIEADPRYALHLGNFALFMQKVRNNMDYAEELYQRAIEADPRHANNLGNFAGFMEDVRNNIDRAEELYQRAIEADPRHANNLGNFSSFLLANGKREAGLTRLQAAFDLAPKERELQVELLFYAATHAPDAYPRALAELKERIQEGCRSPGWNLKTHVEIARQRQDPRLELLTRLAAVISDGADPAILEELPLWQEA
ncbi:MAG: tetratricopeptide repeat protein [Magnetococcales bacterium]|nr:tetratricopeptide repeat protein [Magnetococcales bacterium]